MNIAHLVLIQARRHPDAVALIEARESLTWAALQDRIETASWHMREAGLAEGDVVALSLRSSIAYSVAALAALHLGATACLIDWRAPPAEVARMQDVLRPNLVVTDRALTFAAQIAQLGIADLLRPLGKGAAAPDLAGMPAAPAFLMLSSGSTGRPKAAAISHRAATWRGFARVDATAMRRGLRVMQVMPVASAAGLACLVSQLLAGATTWFAPLLAAPHAIVETILRERIEQTGMVPTIARGMMELASGDKPLFPDIEAVMVQSARFHIEEKRLAMARLTPNIYDGYGSLGTGMITVASPADTELSPASVGRAVPFCHIEIVDADGRPLPTDGIGRIRVRSAGLADGYIGVADGADEVLIDGWSYPGDLGRLDGNGLLYIEGRAASMIIRGGQTLYPEEIERVLLAFPAVAEAAVIGRADPRLGEVPVALVVARGALVEADLVAHCRRNLQAAKVPLAFHSVPSLPRTENGKIRRSALAALLDQSAIPSS